MQYSVDKFKWEDLFDIEPREELEDDLKAAQNEAIINACVNKTKSPEDYEKFKTILPGSLIDVTFGLNDFNNKTFVAKLDIVEQSLFDAETIYQ